MKALKGSEKQIKWATQIRDEVFSSIEHSKKFPASTEYQYIERNKDFIDKVFDKMDEAKFSISNRNVQAIELMRFVKSNIEIQ